MNSVITGATRIEQVQENPGALDVEITDETLSTLDGILGLCP
jgi:aryl-alcohol dehydrogenase-like predicted oxidoreductase